MVLCLILGKRRGFGRTPMPPHSMVLCLIGTGMLWVGWYGFNAGSALAADGVAANAFMTTTLATATAAFVWPTLEYFLRGKPSILGYCSGRGGGPGRHYPGVRLRQRHGGHHHRRLRGADPLLLRGQGQGRGSAMTTPWTPSAFTRWAARWARC